MHLYDLRVFLVFVVIVFSLNFAFCGESVYLDDGAERQEPPRRFRRSELIASLTDRYASTASQTTSSRLINKRDIQIPSKDLIDKLAVGEDVTKDEPAPSVDIGRDINNKTVKKQLKKQDDGIDVLQNTPVLGNSSTISEDKKTVPEHSTPDPGAKTRGVIVFGSLGLVSFVYLAYKIYSKRKRDGEGNRRGDLQQFKYGVLTSAETDDRLEMARLPLHLQSEDEETDIFDLERRNLTDEKDTSHREADVEDAGTGDDDLLDLREPNDRFVDVL